MTRLCTWSICRMGRESLRAVVCARLACKGQHHTPVSVPCSYSQESGTLKFGDDFGDSTGDINMGWPIG